MHLSISHAAVTPMKVLTMLMVCFAISLAASFSSLLLNFGSQSILAF